MTENATEVAVMDVMAMMRGFGGRVEGHKRCGEFRYYADDGTPMDHLPCTRRRGHAGRHRIRVRRVGVRGRKHVTWAKPHFHVEFRLAT